MVAPTTERFHQMVLEVELVDGSGTFTKICGMTGRTVNRTTTMSTTEVPADCDDESLAANVEVAPQSSQVTISATAVWAAQSHGFMMDWWYLKQRKSIRVGHLLAEAGDTEYETGPAYLVNVNDTGELGQGKVTREIEINFDGLPTRTAAASSGS